MARKVFISVLGFSNYGQCIYVKDNYKSLPVRFIQEATLEYLQTKGEWTIEDAAYILLTQEAEAANWVNDGQRDRDTKQVISCEGLQHRLRQMHLPFEVHTISNLPHGNSEEEIWTIFEQLFSQLRDDDELYFDLTHGFRYLPMLVMVLINYSKFLCNTKVCSITYGNYESRNRVTNEAPIIDLLPLSVLQDWTFAAAQYLDSGNVSRLALLSRDKITPILKASAGKDIEAKTLQQMVKFLELSVQDMLTCRGININEASHLSMLKEKMAQLESTTIKPLNPIFNKIRKSFEAFSDTPDVMNGFVAAKWCIEHELYQQAITILQENVVTLICGDFNLDEKDDKQRKLVNSAFVILKRNLSQSEWVLSSFDGFDEEKQRTIISAMLENDKIKLFSNVFEICTGIRNDFNHSGMRQAPSSAQTLKKRITELVDCVIKEYTDYVYR